MKILVPLCVATIVGAGIWVLEAQRQTLQVTQVLGAPDVYDGKTVRVTGQVIHNVGLFGAGAYLLTDGRSQVAVVTSEGVPLEGHMVEVEGTFHVALSIGAVQQAVIIVGGGTP
jgi:hypothetical protein